MRFHAFFHCPQGRIYARWQFIRPKFHYMHRFLSLGQRGIHNCIADFDVNNKFEVVSKFRGARITP